MDIFQIYVLIYLLLYFGLVIGLQSILLYIKTRAQAAIGWGRNGQKKWAEWFIQIALLLLLVIGLNYVFIPENYSYFLPIPKLELGWLQTTGFVIGVLALLLTFIAQRQMQESWRLGIDEDSKTKLVTTGLFTISRNPVYLNLGISFLGFFLMAPNWGSVLFIALMFYGVSRKIRDEEAFLERRFGAEYRAYRVRVRRWI